jgi:hypothetical protein
MLPVFTAPVLAGFIVGHAGSRRVALALVATLALYVHVVFTAVPHVKGLEDWDPALVGRIRAQTAGLVLVENSPHLDMIESPLVSSLKTPFAAHFEPLLPEATDRRFYAGFWDGWQWSAFRQNLLAAGAMWGRSLEEIPPQDVVREFVKWGIRDAFVWSPAAQRYFAALPQFDKQWESPHWQHFVRRSADTRSVITTAGSGTLAAFDRLGGRVELRDVTAGANVIVRTNYYPAWTARVESDEIPLFPADGLLAFRAPRSGSYDVQLIYPRRLWLLALSMSGFVLGLAALYASLRCARLNVFRRIHTAYEG